MSLKQQIIEDRVESLAKMLGVDHDEAFLRFSHSLVTGRSVHNLDPADLVEGGQDKQLDVITIDDQAANADVYILQCKNSTGFSSNALIQLGNGLQWLFDRPRAEVLTLGNAALRDKIYEYRSIQSSLGPANIRIHVRFITKGQTSFLSDEFLQEWGSLRSRYHAQDVFEAFEIEPLGVSELVALLNAQERRTRKIDSDIRIKYDANTPSLLKYYSQGIKGLVCTVPAQEIARIVNDDPDGAVFDLNVRRYLGTRGGVNKDILKTCTAAQESYEFWFLNNGLTVVCDSFDAVTDPDHPHVKLRNMQIVNGCQTATTLALAQAEGTLSPDVRILVRIYETPAKDLVDRIVLTTNNQNRIGSRDLKANDSVQIDMERAFSIFGFLYERKARQHDQAGVDSSLVIPNEAVGQWYLAIVRRNPADARGRKYKLWEEHYSAVFGGTAVEPHLISALVGRQVRRWIRASGFTEDPDDFRRMLVKRGQYHLGRIVAPLWLKDDIWAKTRGDLGELVHALRDGDVDLSPFCERAFVILEETIEGVEEDRDDLDRALKSYSLNERLGRAVRKALEA